MLPEKCVGLAVTTASTPLGWTAAEVRDLRRDVV